MLNSIVLMGRLVADPDLRTTTSNISVASFTLAVERNFADKATGKREADFIDIVAWRSTAEFVNRYFRKGQLVCVQGSLQSRKWQDKDGNNRVNWEVQADNVFFAESKKDSGSSDSGYSAPARREEPSTFSSGNESDYTPIPDDDLPF